MLCPEDGQFCSGYTMRTAEEYSGSSITSIPDDDPGDERISFCLELTALQGTLRGGLWISRWTPSWTAGGAIRGPTGRCSTRGCDRGHQGPHMGFEDVALNYPDQAVRLDIDVDIPYRDGTATLTGLEITPLTATVRIEGLLLRPPWPLGGPASGARRGDCDRCRTGGLHHHHGRPCGGHQHLV